jgi:hypothetical protein
MDIIEYLLFVPLLIYGMALSDLFGQWKKFMEPASWYIPYLFTLIMITEIGVHNVFIFFKLSPQLSTINYFAYWLYLLPPLVFLLMVNFLTHTDDYSDMKVFFTARTKPVFLLLAAFISMHFIPIFHFDHNIWLPRVLGIIFCTVYAFWQRMIVFYLLVAIWLLSVGTRFYIVYK